MIGKIKGRLDELDGNEGLIETSSGVYYRVFLSNSLLTTCFPPCEIETYTYHHVREDAQQLFGFQNKNEYKLFELLLSVNGVGAKSAFTIVSFSQVEELVKAVRNNDVKYFTRIKGLGKKTALKIILELSGKFDSEFVFEAEKLLSDEDQTVLDALASLGFSKKEASQILEEIPSDLGVEDKIKEGIQRLTTHS